MAANVRHSQTTNLRQIGLNCWVIAIQNKNTLHIWKAEPPKELEIFHHKKLAKIKPM